jgi:hypothetical protein
MEGDGGREREGEGGRMAGGPSCCRLWSARPFLRLVFESVSAALCGRRNVRDLKNIPDSILSVGLVQSSSYSLGYSAGRLH